MRKQTSRIISMILSLAMLAAFVLAPLPVANAAATKTIYFDNSGYGWSAVYVYTWNGSGDCTGGWPGSAMTKVDGSIYSYEVPADAVNIIFTDNSGNQTADMTLPTDDNNLFNGSGWSVYGTAVETITVYFDNSKKGWSEVYAYAWTGNTPAIGAWPGTAMTLVKDSVYSVEIPAGTANVIFNNNAGSQTGDLAIPTDGHYYFGANETWGAYPPTEEPTTPPVTEPDTPDVVDFYLVGFINGANYGCEEDYENMGEYKFVDGKLTATFTADSYVFLKTTGNAAWYMAESYCISSGCFMYANGTEKLFVPGNVELEFTLMQFGDGSLHLSYNEITYECSHDYTVTKTEPTCTEEGAEVYTCTKCGDGYTNILGAAGHSYTPKVTTAATCTKTGVKTFTCSACKDSYTEVIPANGHSYSNGKCTVCGTIDPNCDHSYKSQVTIAATCLEDGVKTYTCSKCGDVYTETIAATGHKYIDIIVPPTCENNGYTQHKCEYCGTYGINSDAVNPIGHNYSSVVTDPTCTEKGYTTYTCANCGNVYTWNETEPTGHNYVYGKCTTCGDVDAGYVKAYYLFGFINGYNYGCEDDYENMGEYKFVDGQLTVTFETASYVGVKVTNNDAWYMAQSYCEDTSVTLYNTTTGAGEKLYVPGNTEVTFTLVENADDTLTLSYSAGECEHLFSSYVETQPTCTTAGNRVNTCGYCGYSYDQPMDALGHTFENGLCLTCGAADPEYVTPDYYLFGYINGADYGWKDDIANIGEYKFVDGKLSAKFTETSYVAVKTGDNAHFYMTNGYVGEVSSVTLVEFADPTSVAANRLYVPGGVTVDFTLSVNSKGSLVLSYSVSSDDCSHADHNTDGLCSFCGAAVEHSYTLGVCSICGVQDPDYVPYRYYLFGYINGANYGCEEDYTNLGEYLFENGTLTATFAADSYVGIKEVNPGAKFGPEVVAWYMTDGWQGEATSVTLYNSTTLAVSDKLFVPGNAVITFTMVKNEDGTVTLSYTAESLECKHEYVNGICSICGAADPNYTAPDDSYVLVTDIAQITAGGNFVIVANNGDVCQAMSTTLTSGKFVGVDVTVNGQLVTGTDLPVWTIEAVSGGVALLVDGSYLKYNSSTNFATSASSYTWTVVAGESGFIFDSAATTRGIYYQISSGKFGAYSTTNANASGYISNLQLYKYNGEIPTECSHSYTEEITTAATCEKAGVKTYTCTKCGDSYTETIAALGHSYVNGSCSNCGAQDPSQVTYDYYLFGYINGANYGCEEDYTNLGEYLFENGTLTATFAADSYVGVKEVNPSAEVVAWYMTAGWQGEVTSVTLFDSTTLSVPDKLFVPAGVTLTFTLVKNENGTLTLSYVAEETECKHTYTAQQLSAATCKEYATYSLTCSKCGDTETVSANELANRWLYAVPGGMSESTFENKTVYRYRDLAAVWNKTGVNTVYYVNSWPSGFDTSNVLYSQYNNLSKKVTASETDTTKLSVDSDAIIGYLYYHWCYEGYSYTVANKSGNYNRFHAYYSTKAPSEANSHDASDDSYRFDEATACADSNWYFYVPVYGQTYSTYNNEGGWGAWSAWSIAAVSASDTRQVESASMYRYTAAALVDHDYGYAITSEPTCVAYGVKTFTCINCNGSYTETIAPTGHKYVEGYCPACGCKDPDYVDPDDIPDATFYLVGYINGANHGCEEDYENMGQYKFVDGKLVATFETDSYVFLKTEGNANWYMSMIYGDSVKCNFYNTSTGAAEKMFVPGGVELTFTLTAMGNDSYLLSYTTPSMVCPHTSHNLDGICDRVLPVRLYQRCQLRLRGRRCQYWQV